MGWQNVCNLSKSLAENVVRRMLCDDMCNLMGRSDNMFTQMLRFVTCPSGKLGWRLLGVMEDKEMREKRSAGLGGQIGNMDVWRHCWREECQLGNQ